MMSKYHWLNRPFVAIFVIYVISAVGTFAAEEETFVFPEIWKDTERDAFLNGVFPEDFIWGVSTAAYQIEGAWNTSNKGENIWDRFTHEGGHVYNNDTGDVACDSYHKFNEDIQLMTAMGLDFYRFSISWARLLPYGDTGFINPDGLRYYNDLINGLIANGIAPMVTLYHWDLPQALQDGGGWIEEEIVDRFEDYAMLCFGLFGDRVKWWITFNEPFMVTGLGHILGLHAPGIVDTDGTIGYKVAHNLMRSHARASHIYNQIFKNNQNGSIGITLNSDWYLPYNDSLENVMATERVRQFWLGWFANPIFGDGDYPVVMKEMVAEKSFQQGLNVSRLPEFTAEEKELNKGSADFFGLNQYTASYVINQSPDASVPIGYISDREAMTFRDEEWPSTGSEWLKIVPWGMRNLLNWIADEYGDDIAIIITENGMSTEDVFELDDELRIKYYTAYINELMKAKKIDGVNVKGYTAWSLMDNFEWFSGYSERFGLHYVNFSDPERTRTPKNSAKAYAAIVKNNGFPKVNDGNQVKYNILLLTAASCSSAASYKPFQTEFSQT